MNADPSNVPDIVRVPGQYNSFTFTIRPRCGVGEEIQQIFEKFLIKNFEFHFLCAEMEDEARHLHGQVWFPNSRKKGDFKKTLQRVQEKCDPDWSPASSKVLAGGIKIAYSSNWVEEYLTKEDGWILNNPPEYEDKYYPSQEEQESVKAKANAVDSAFHHWSVLYKESQFNDLPLSKESVAMWFHDAMFCSKKIRVQIDSRKRIQNRDCLYHYLRENPDGWKCTFKSKAEKDSEQLILMSQMMEVQE